jgi:chromosome segregation ATPase
MLVALLLGTLLLGGSAGGLWFLGGQTPHQLQTAVAKLEPDKTSRQPIDYTLDQVEAQSKRLQSERKELEKEVFAAMERHDTPADQFRTLAARSDKISASVGRDLLDLRFALRSQLSEEQWRRLFPPSTVPVAAVTSGRSVSN